jgi:hypothetical protein
VEVEEHVAGCVDCRRRFEEMQRLVDGVATLPKVQPAPQFLADVRRKIAAGEQPREFNWVDVLFRPAWLKLPLEALAALVIAMSLWIHERTVPYVPDHANRRLARNRSAQEFKTETAPVPPAEAVASDEVETKRAADRRNAGENRPQSLASAPPAMPEKGGTRRAEVAWRDEKRLSLAERSPSGEGGGVNLEQPKLAAAIPMIISNETTLLLERAPMETVVIESSDTEALRHRLDELARSLNGQSMGASEDGNGGERFYVSLPAKKVASFKAQFAVIGKLTVAGKLAFAAEKPAEAKPKDEALLSAKQARATGTDTNTVVIEIRVLPAKP